MSSSAESSRIPMFGVSELWVPLIEWNLVKSRQRACQDQESGTGYLPPESSRGETSERNFLPGVVCSE